MQSNHSGKREKEITLCELNCGDLVGDEGA